MRVVPVINQIQRTVKVNNEKLIDLTNDLIEHDLEITKLINDLGKSSTIATPSDFE